MWWDDLTLAVVDDDPVGVVHYRNSVRYYENHGRYNDDWRQYAALKREDLRALYNWLLARPASTQTQVLAGAAPGWSRSTLRHALGVLKAAGLVAERKDGRLVHYWAIALQKRGQTEPVTGSPATSAST